METRALTPNVTLLTLTSRTGFAESIAASVADLLRRDIETRGQGSLAVSGGTTPIPIFEALRAQELDWSKVFITLADERWVPASHEDSTERLVREHLFKPGMNFVGLVNKATSAAEGEDETHRNLLTLPRPLTATLLGLGEDGHTASLFPNHSTLKKAFDKGTKRLCAAVSDAPKPPPERMTLTYPALIDSGRILFHITGAAKLPLIEQLLQDGPAEDMPARAFLKQTAVPVDIYYAE